MPELDPFAYAAIFVALALGGTLKGAVGMGAPLIAVPVIASFVDVRFAVVLLVLPNLCTNSWQLWKYRGHHPKGGLGLRFALSGAGGAVIGSIVLANTSPEILSRLVAFTVLAYIGLRVARPGFQLAFDRGLRLSWPLGAVAGFMQGAGGISAPVSVSFLNALKLDRLQFIPTISLFFATMSLVQAPTLAWYGLLDWNLAFLGIFAVLPLLAFMPVGAFLARYMSRETFDRITLAVLFILAIKLLI